MVFASLPFALAAGFFPAGLATVTWLLSGPAAIRRGVWYLAGAALSTAGSGVAILVLQRSIGGSAEQSSVVAGFELGIGTLLAVGALWLVVRRPVFDRAPSASRLAIRCRRGGAAGPFILGMAMWTPSLAYVAALESIVDAHLGVLGTAVNLFVVDVAVLATVELPVLVYALRPAQAAKTLERWRDVLARLGWRIAAPAAAIGSVYLLIQGSQRMA
jgi:hypothetical protein